MNELDMVKTRIHSFLTAALFLNLRVLWDLERLLQ